MRKVEKDTITSLIYAYDTYICNIRHERNLNPDTEAAAVDIDEFVAKDLCVFVLNEILSCIKDEIKIDRTELEKVLCSPYLLTSEEKASKLITLLEG